MAQPPLWYQSGGRAAALLDVIIEPCATIFIGHAIAAFCHAGGWFSPMYGAGRLEWSNIVEYEDAALFASRCGHHEMIDCLLTMAEVEWEHEKYFREKVTGHWMLRIFPLWEPAPPKETIRAKLASVA